jgi:DNA polymerase III subunit epsilon
MPYLPTDYASMASALEQSGDYRILRRLVPRTLSKPPPDNSKIAVVIDFETTGLDTAQDEVMMSAFGVIADIASRLRHVRF